MLKPGYTKIRYKYIPHDIRDHCNLDAKLAHNGYIYCKIKKGVYGLKQAAILAFENLITNLSSNGYTLVPNTIGI